MNSAGTLTCSSDQLNIPAQAQRLTAEAYQSVLYFFQSQGITVDSELAGKLERVRDEEVSVMWV